MFGACFKNKNAAMIFLVWSASWSGLLLCLFHVGDLTSLFGLPLLPYLLQKLAPDGGVPLVHSAA